MIETNRLVLRPWHERDRAPFHAIKSDPRVMATLGPLQSRAESDATLDRWIARAAEWGHSFWAMERRADGVLLGYCGLVYPPAGTPVAGEREIGWGLGSQHWHRGYAREAAAATLAWGWANTDSARVVAITTPGNTASWGLMERLGMTRLQDGDFRPPGAGRRRPAATAHQLRDRSALRFDSGSLNLPPSPAFAGECASTVMDHTLATVCI